MATWWKQLVSKEGKQWKRLVMTSTKQEIYMFLKFLLLIISVCLWINFNVFIHSLNEQPICFILFMVFMKCLFLQRYSNVFISYKLELKIGPRYISWVTTMNSTATDTISVIQVVRLFNGWFHCKQNCYHLLISLWFFILIFILFNSNIFQTYIILNNIFFIV